MMLFSKHTSSFLFAWLLTFIGCGQIFGQQNWGYTQYSFNLFDINQAYAGNHGVSSFALRNRLQWIGVEGAPKTQQLSWHAPMMKSKLGVGIRLQNESIGARVQQSFRAALAYKLKIESGTLSMSVGGGFFRQNFSRDKIVALNMQESQLESLGEPIVSPVLDAAIFYNTTRFYLGIEASRFDRSKFGLNDHSVSRNYIHLNTVVGYKHKIGKSDMIDVSTLIKFSEGNVIQPELNAQYLRDNLFSLGLGYRHMGSFYPFLGLYLNPQFRLGLSYDLPFTQLSDSRAGTFELFLGYNLKNDTNKSIRYFK